MTVEQLLELLREQYPQALVSVEMSPCAVFSPPDYYPGTQEGEVVAVRSDSRKGRVYIEADGHDC